jgi:hypothetical protein
MKGLDETPRADGQELVADQSKEFKYVGRRYAKKGHILFEYNAQTDDIVPATILEEKGKVSLDNKIVTGTKKVFQKKDCTYFWALNLKNAQRKILMAKKEFIMMQALKNVNIANETAEHSAETDNSGANS